MKSFKDMKLPNNMLRSLERNKFFKPTPIQEKSIPLIMEGSDVLGSSETGSGKTAAFSIPLISNIINGKKSYGLITCPTRELAQQIYSHVNNLIDRKDNIKTSLLIGGEPIHKQLRTLKSDPKIIIGTPGRINDHLKKKNLRLNKITYFVLDETDRMLDMGFEEQIEKIKQSFKAKPQTILFSASIPKEIIKLTNKYLVKPTRVEVGVNSLPVSSIDQQVINLTKKEKYKSLLKVISKIDGLIMVFMKTKRETKRITKNLQDENYKAGFMNGDLPQRKRERVLSNFTKGKIKILIATDIASRGIDISNIRLVINYDIPEIPEDYVHRIGRTARAGKDGKAISFITGGDGGKWKRIQNLIKKNDVINKKNRK